VRLWAGPVGLAVSAALTVRGVDHVVLERGRVAETWRTQRWDSFRLNTPGWMNQMLGGQASSAFAVGAEVVQRLDALAAECPVRPGTQIAGLAPNAAGHVVQTNEEVLHARKVVVATATRMFPGCRRWPEIFLSG
jgi:putative flavoprotein involved in K+ transport